ncbi:MAG: hypothetical protein PHS80_00155 [Methanothrix sp.]|nr:hypothetical protein [Methanothrix sp.]
MKKKNQEKVLKLLKELDLYKKIEPKIFYSFNGEEPKVIQQESYIRVNDVVDWGALIKEL